MPRDKGTNVIPNGLLSLIGSRFTSRAFPTYSIKMVDTHRARDREDNAKMVDWGYLSGYSG